MIEKLILQVKLTAIFIYPAELKEERSQWAFIEELKNINESTIRPVPASKIPVGRYRVETEKDVMRSVYNLSLIHI